MKRFFSIAMSLVSAAVLWGQEPYSINGRLTGIDNDTVVIELRDTRSNNTIATGSIVGGRFSLTGSAGSVAQPVMLLIYDKGIPYANELWVQGGSQTDITGNAFDTQVWSVQNKVPQQIEQNRYTEATRAELMQLQNLVASMYKAYEAMEDKNAVTADKDEAKRRFDIAREGMIMVTDSMFVKEMPIMKQSANDDVLLNKLAVYATLYRNLGNYKNINRLREFYASLPDSLKNTDLGGKISSALLPFAPALIGKPAIDQPMAGIDGRTHTLAQYKGKYLLIDFWASWCQPCVLALSEVREVSEKYKDIITVAGINLDARDIDWRQASNRHNITWVNLHDGDGFKMGLHKQYKGQGIPYYVLISPEGIVLDVWSGYRQGDLQKHIGAYVED